MLQLALAQFQLAPFRLDLLGPVFWHQQGVVAAEGGQLVLDFSHLGLQAWGLLIEKFQALGQFYLPLAQ